jgi:hypothetical protein
VRTRFGSSAFWAGKRLHIWHHECDANTVEVENQTNTEFKHGNVLESGISIGEWYTSVMSETIVP